MNDDQRYREPGWWSSLTPLGQTAIAVLATVLILLAMILVGSIE